MDINWQSYECLSKARKFKKGLYEEQVMEVHTIIATKSKMSLAILNNEILEAN